MLSEQARMAAGYLSTDSAGGMFCKGFSGHAASGRVACRCVDVTLPTIVAGLGAATPPPGR